VGQAAVIEAYITFDPTKGCSRRTWTNKVIRWRAREELVRASGGRLLPDPDVVDQVPDNVTPDVLFEKYEGLELIGRLDPRPAAILQAWLHGWTYAEIGMSLGLSTQRVHKVAQKALADLRTWLDEEDGVD
jgi:DNA-directed RNA polymerase specialized sigma24 family protein